MNQFDWFICEKCGTDYVTKEDWLDECYCFTCYHEMFPCYCKVMYGEHEEDL